MLWGVSLEFSRAVAFGAHPAASWGHRRPTQSESLHKPEDSVVNYTREVQNVGLLPWVLAASTDLGRNSISLIRWLPLQNTVGLKTHVESSGKGHGHELMA